MPQIVAGASLEILPKIGIFEGWTSGVVDRIIVARSFSAVQMAVSKKENNESRFSLIRFVSIVLHFCHISSIYKVRTSPRRVQRVQRNL